MLSFGDIGECDWVGLTGGDPSLRGKKKATQTDDKREELRRVRPIWGVWECPTG